MDIIEKATQIAITAHKDQVRKTDGTLYVVHPITVSRMLERHGFSDTVFAAALVHDVLEDTDVSEKNLREALGDNVADVVLAVSEDKNLEWEERKKQYIERVKEASVEVKAVSVGDKIHNLMTLIDGYKREGKRIWTHFNRGKKEKIWFEESLLAALKETWNHPLLDEYEQLLEIVKTFED